MKANICVVPLCRATREDITTFKFPLQTEIGKKWIDAIGNADLAAMNYEDIIKKHFFVCKKHFAPNSYNTFTYKNGNKTQLVRGTIPSRFTPDIVVIGKNFFSII